MMLRVMYTDGTFDQVNRFMLEALIQSRRVKKFKRASGWADVNAYQIRSKEGHYAGPERRTV